MNSILKRVLDFFLGGVTNFEREAPPLKGPAVNPDL